MIRRKHLYSTAVLVPLFLGAIAQVGAQEFEIPLRINMGGPEVTDQEGNLWLGDGAGAGDLLNIRPNDAGGTNTISEGGWCTPDPVSIDDLGLDSLDPAIITVLSSIRWDDSADANDFIIELPIPDGAYKVHIYACENCCPQRHWKIELQGEIVEPDVSMALYADFVGGVGRLEYSNVVVNNGVLRIGLLPCPECDCPECVGGVVMDNNAIISALEVMSDVVCTGDDFNFNCLYDPGADRVTATWDTVPSAEGYRVLKNGSQFLDLPQAATSFTDADPRSEGPTVLYVLQALDGGEPFAECRCTVVTQSCPRGLACDVDNETGVVSLSWEAASGIEVTDFEMRRDGQLLETLPGTATSYEDTPTERSASYTVTPLTDPPGQCAALSCSVRINAILFEVPFRLNAGGPEVTDSFGNIWLGDQGAGLDPLDLRPFDVGGSNTIENWCTPDPATIEALGMNPNNPRDVTIFRSIRWDGGGDGIDYRLEIPVPDDAYTVNMFFCETCCDQRHFKIEIEGEIVADDVRREIYAQAHHQVGKLSFEDIVVEDRLLEIGLLPCPECPCPQCVGGVVLDINPLLSALEVLPSDFDPCTQEGFGRCPSNLTCTLEAAGAVTGSWDPPQCGEPASYEVFKNGESLTTLAGDATSFTDTLSERVGFYEVVAVPQPGDDACSALSCSLVREEIDFEVPLRINMGGPWAVDSQGRAWLGDPGAGADILAIRPDDLGGFNTNPNWCDVSVQANADSFHSLGLDPLDPNDLAIFDSIRWDVADDDGDLLYGEDDDFDGGDIDFRIELPVPNGDYLVNLYVTECCCPTRHFQVEIQDDLVADDVHNLSLNQSGDLGRTGRLSFDDISVTDGLLHLRLFACPLCPGVGDYNPMINALEVLPAGTEVRRCPRDLVCTLGFDATVTGVWLPPEDVEVTSYELRRNGDLIDNLPGSATDFVDEPPCERATTYEVVPVVADSPCPDLAMVCTVIDITCPFAAPVRINMGGPELQDSAGRVWISDAGQALDPLDIRPDDLGGQNAAVNWGIANFQPDSLEPLGFDPANLVDSSLMSTIRWDPADDFVDFVMEIPIADGDYDVNLYFCENFWNPPEQRHFRLEIQEEVVEDVSTLVYSPDRPEMGWAGKLSFEVEVEDGILRIALPPCDPAVECPGATDLNSIINLLEILPETTTEGPFFVRGDSNADGGRNITDGVFIFSFLFTGGQEPPCKDAADTSDQGGINITSGIYILNFLFLGGPEPPAPFPACGRDTSADQGGADLGCASFPPCQ